MATKTVVKQKVQTSTRTKQDTQETVENKRASKISTIIISVLITFIIAYISVDYFVINKKLDNKVLVITQKFDSLKIHLDEKLPAIDKAIQIQQQQVKDLQNMSVTLVKK